MTAHTIAYPEPRRELASLSARIEKRILVSLARRMPAWVTSDHLTLLGFLALGAAGLCYRLAAIEPLFLHGVNLCLLLNWFGDSLDGTLARVRACPRPRYGFYLDHMADAFGVLLLALGLASSGLIDLRVATGVLLVYQLLSIHIGLRAAVEGCFQIAYAGIGGTELRIAVGLANLAALRLRGVVLAGLQWFDILGLVMAAGLTLILVGEVRATLGRLARAEPRTVPADWSGPGGRVE